VTANDRASPEDLQRSMLSDGYAHAHLTLEQLWMPAGPVDEAVTPPTPPSFLPVSDTSS
jgi:hypothetical protein